MSLTSSCSSDHIIEASRFSTAFSVRYFLASIKVFRRSDLICRNPGSVYVSVLSSVAMPVSVSPSGCRAIGAMGMVIQLLDNSGLAK